MTNKSSERLLDWARKRREGRSETYEEQARDATERILDEVDQITELPSVTITEEQFVKVFLPFFASEPENNIYNVNEHTWAAIAKGYFNPVQVVDASGHPLFIVPGAYNNQLLQNRGHDMSNSVGEILSKTNDLIYSRPKTAVQLLNRSLGNDIDEMLDIKKAVENLVLWNIIFRRYNKPLIEVEGFDLDGLERDLAVNNQTGDSLDEKTQSTDIQPGDDDDDEVCDY